MPRTGPTWRGPTHDGISAETTWSPEAVAAGKVLWRASVGKGHSSFAVAGGRVYTLGNTDNQDTVFCFDAETGEEVWTKSYACRAGNYPGPRSTPTVDGTLVYTLSREGHLHCLDAASGDVKWTQKVATEVPRWGLASSPIVDGDLVVVNAGTSGTAFDKKTGKLEWSAAAGMPGYASPVAMKRGSKLSFLLFSKDSLVCVSGKTGKPRVVLPLADEVRRERRRSPPRGQEQRVHLVGLRQGLRDAEGHVRGCEQGLAEHQHEEPRGELRSPRRPSLRIRRQEPRLHRRQDVATGSGRKPVSARVA